MCVGLARAAFCHPPPLMLPTLTANTAVHGRAGGAVPEVCPAEAVRAASNFSDHSGSVLASPPDLVGGQAKFTEHRAERFAVVDRVEELLPQLYGESASESCCTSKAPATSKRRGNFRHRRSQRFRRKAHGRLRNFTPVNRLVLRSTVTIATRPGLEINSE